jgi:hypothetical protein
MPRPKQHHYVTEAYLEGFRAPLEKQLFCHGRNRGFFQKSPNELASQRNFYAIKTEDGQWDDSLEHLIEKAVESPGLPVVKKLSEGKTRLNWQDRQALSLLVAFQEMRTPAARQQARSATKALTDRILQEVKAANPEQKSIELIGKSGGSSTATLEEIAASQDDLENDHSEEIHRLAMGPALKLHRYYKRMKYTVHYPLGEAKFITTDTPVITCVPRQPGPRDWHRSEGRSGSVPFVT